MYRTGAMLLITVAALSCLTVSCGNKPMSDQSLTTDIQAKLYNDATTKPASIKVDVKDGVATLSGDVPSSDVELAAMKIANSTAGIRSVNDQMKVNPAMAANQPPPDAGAGAGPPASSTPQPPPNAPPQPAPSNPAAAATPPPAAAAVAPAPTEPAPPPPPKIVTVPAGEQISVRMIDGIDSARNTAGQTFRASLSAPVRVHGRTIFPTGTDATVLLANAKGAGRIRGQSELEVELSGIMYKGHTYELTSSTVQQQGQGRGKQSAVRTGIGAAAGAIIGAIAGGGKGAAIGSLAGGGAGAGYQLFTHGQQVKIPSETVLTFSLQAPIEVHERGQ